MMSAAVKPSPNKVCLSRRWPSRGANSRSTCACTSAYRDGSAAPSFSPMKRKTAGSSVAAARGEKDGAKGRDIAAERMTPGQIAEAQKLTREWETVAIGGQGVPQDPRAGCGYQAKYRQVPDYVCLHPVSRHLAERCPLFDEFVRTLGAKRKCRGATSESAPDPKPSAPGQAGKG